MLNSGKLQLNWLDARALCFSSQNIRESAAFVFSFTNAFLCVFEFVYTHIVMVMVDMQCFSPAMVLLFLTAEEGITSVEVLELGTIGVDACF